MSVAYDEYVSAAQALAEAAALIKKNESAAKYSSLMSEADEAARSENKAAELSYRNFINPYGANAEELSDKGLKDSGLMQSSAARAYSAYQNRVAENASATQKNKGELLRQQLSDDTQTDLELLSGAMKLSEEGMEDYWNQLKWDYQLKRDEIEDERYERAWAYKTKKKKRSVSSSSSSSKSSKASSSSSSSSSSSGASGSSGVKSSAKLETLKKVVKLVGADKSKVKSEASLAAYLNLAKSYGATSAELKELEGYYRG